MDLKIEDVADLLQVKPTLIHTLVNNGKIPFYRIEDQFRFSRMEIENWVLKSNLGASGFNASAVEEEDQAAMGNKQFSLYRAIHRGGVLHKVAGDNKAAVIRNAMKTIAKDFHLDAEVLIDLLMDRENLQPTALNHGIGIPHTRDSFMNLHQDRVVVAFPAEPIADYGALDGKPVNTLFFLFACDDKRHLHLLAKIAHLSSTPEAVALLETQPNKATLLAYIKEWETSLSKK